MKFKIKYLIPLFLIFIIYIFFSSSIKSQNSLNYPEFENDYFENNIPTGSFSYKYKDKESIKLIKSFLLKHTTCFNSNNIKKEKRRFNKYLKSINSFSVEFNFKDTLDNCIKIHSKIFDSNGLLIMEKEGYEYEDFQYDALLTLKYKNDTSGKALYWMVNQTIVRDSNGYELHGYTKLFYNDGQLSCFSSSNEKDNFFRQYNKKGQLVFEYIGRRRYNFSDTINYFDDNFLFKRIIKNDTSKTTIEYYKKR
jgi:hypothetical protein